MNAQMGMKLAAALVKAQTAMGPAMKDRTGQIGNQKYKYADLPSVMEAIAGPLHANGIAVLQSVEGNIDGIGVRTTLLHESGETWTSDFCFMPVPVKSPQAFGSAATYARRYSLSAMLGVVTDDDDDGAHANPGLPITGEPQPAPRVATTAADLVPALKASIEQRREEDGYDRSMTFAFGRSKGITISQLNPESLNWYAKCFENDLADASKSRFHEKTRAQLHAVNSELARKEG